MPASKKKYFKDFSPGDEMMDSYNKVSKGDLPGAAVQRQQAFANNTMQGWAERVQTSNKKNQSNLPPLDTKPIYQKSKRRT